MRKLVPLLLALLLGAGWPLAAQSLKTVLETAFILETRLLDAEFDRYLEARQSEERALRQLRQRSSRLDQAMGDQSVPVEELRRLEGEITLAREGAFARSREVADLRQRLYLRMDRLTELGVEIERHRDRSLVATGELEGTWRVDVTPISEFGVVEFHLDGTVVSGSYRMSNGARGSIRGTFADNKLKLVRVDAVGGFDATLEGKLDPATGEIAGTWHTLEVGAGRPTSGDWTAYKLSPEEERSLGLEP
jgi:hypothetical protein